MRKIMLLLIIKVSNAALLVTLLIRISFFPFSPVVDDSYGTLAPGGPFSLMKGRKFLYAWEATVEFLLMHPISA